MSDICKEIMYLVKKRRNNEQAKNRTWYDGEQKRKREGPRTGVSPELNALCNVSKRENYDSESDY